MSGYKIKRGKKLYLPATKTRSRARSGGLYACPRDRSIRRFKDEVGSARNGECP
jgi:RNA-directed DNA polymerase